MSQKSASMGGMGGGRTNVSEAVQYIATTSTQFQVLPVQMSVLVPQDRVQDFLIALENSPLAVQVKEMELQRPDARVAKPETGGDTGFGGMGGMMGMSGMMGMGMMRQGRAMSGFGGDMSKMRMGMGQRLLRETAWPG